MTIIEKIKAEIERLKDENRKIKCEANERYCSGYDDAFYDLVPFLSSLESEKPMNQEGLEEEYKDYVENDPVYSKLVNRNAGFGIARHFAQWGAEHLANSNDEVVINDHKVAYDKDKDAITMEEIPNDLEEAAREYGFEEYRRRCNGGEYGTSEDAFIAGAKWHADHNPLPEDTVLFNKGVEEGKRLMMEEAIEYEVGMHGEPITINLDKYVQRARGIFPGDKIRIIICIKED